MSIAYTRQNQSLIGYAGSYFYITGLTAGSKNSLTLTGFPVGNSVNGALPVAVGASAGSCTYDNDPTTFKVDPNDPTQVLIDVYPTTVTAIYLWVW